MYVFFFLVCFEEKSLNIEFFLDQYEIISILNHLTLVINKNRYNQDKITFH